jgi:hypothetical protein
MYFALAPVLHQARRLERLEVGAGQLDVDGKFLRQHFHRLLALGQQASSRLGLRRLPMRATCS